MYGYDVVFCQPELLRRREASGGNVRHVRVQLDPGRVYRGHQAHRGGDGLADGDIHILQAQHQAGLACPICPLVQSMEEVGHGICVTQLVEDVVSRNLHDPQTDVHREPDRLAQDLQRLAPYLWRAAAQGIGAVRTQAHRQDSDP